MSGQKRADLLEEMWLYILCRTLTQNIHFAYNFVWQNGINCSHWQDNPKSHCSWALIQPTYCRTTWLATSTWRHCDGAFLCWQKTTKENLHDTKQIYKIQSGKTLFKYSYFSLMSNSPQRRVQPLGPASPLSIFFPRAIRFPSPFHPTGGLGQTKEAWEGGKGQTNKRRGEGPLETQTLWWPLARPDKDVYKHTWINCRFGTEGAEVF